MGVAEGWWDEGGTEVVVEVEPNVVGLGKKDLGDIRLAARVCREEQAVDEGCLSR